MAIFNMIGGGTSDWELIYEGDAGSPTTTGLLQINNIPNNIFLSTIDHHVLVEVEETYSATTTDRTTGGMFIGHTVDFDGDIGSFLGGFCITNNGFDNPYTGLDWYGGLTENYLRVPRASSSSYKFKTTQTFSVKIYKHS